MLRSVHYAVVGFDGRNEGYLCWPSEDQGLTFDVSRHSFIDRQRAHTAPKDPDAKGRVPALPELDHTGRVAWEGHVGRRSLSMRNLPLLREDDEEEESLQALPDPLPSSVPPWHKSRTWASPLRSNTAPSTPLRTPLRTPTRTPLMTPTRGATPEAVTPVPEEAEETSSPRACLALALPEDIEKQKTCVVCSFLRALTTALSFGFSRLAMGLRRRAEVPAEADGAGQGTRDVARLAAKALAFPLPDLRAGLNRQCSAPADCSMIRTTDIVPWKADGPIQASDLDKANQYLWELEDRRQMHVAQELAVRVWTAILKHARSRQMVLAGGRFSMRGIDSALDDEIWRLGHSRNVDDAFKITLNGLTKELGLRAEFPKSLGGFVCRLEAPFLPRP